VEVSLKKEADMREEHPMKGQFQKEGFNLRLYDLHNQGFFLTPRYSFVG
jgi:hypothetical protein